MLDIVLVSSDKASFKWGEIVDNHKFYALHPAQRDLLAASQLYKYSCGFFGTGAGKTALLPLIVYQHIVNARKASNTELWRCLIVSPTTKIFESSQLLYHLQTVFSGTALEGVWRAGEQVYSIPAANAEIIVRTAENDYQRLTGGVYDLILADEAWAMSDPEIFAEIRRRSNMRSAPVVIVTTPNVDGWIYDELYLPWEKGEPEYYVRQASTSANPAKTPPEHKKFLDSELRKMGQARFDRMYGGQFAVLSGLVYDCFSDPQAPAWPVIGPASCAIPICLGCRQKDS